MAEQEPREARAHLPWRHCEAPGVHTLCNLTPLLDKLQKGHRDDVRLYTSGHLNPDKLYRPPETVLQHWANARRPPAEAGPRAEAPSARRVARMKAALAYFTVRTALSPRDGHGAPLFRYLHPAGPASDDDLALRAWPAGRLPGRRGAGEPSAPEVEVLRYRRPLSSRQCAAAPPGPDRFRRVDSYLAGVTRADQHRQLLRFQKDVLAKQDLLDNDFTGRKAALAHEKKLERGLQKLCVCAPQELGRLSVFSDVFEDICSSSLIFGEILKEIKDEYELYMAILLETCPTEQHEAFLDFLQGMERRPVRTPEVQQAREQLRQLVTAVQAALARNDGLRRELETEQTLLDAARAQAELSDNVTDEESLTLIQKVEKKRCEIHNKWDEIQALEREIKATLIHTEVSNITENAIKSIETETLKLETANRILRKNINIIETYVRKSLRKNRISEQDQENIWTFINQFVKETDSNSPDPAKVTNENLQPPCT
ncbi:uncharacterized protein C6orf118 homolog [Talpa occidentalis]|uniref:uncharacterized protein C6orf118 homolog n=1 Tax=Talpa occidentalis TaxID=50954 RepID=UPI00188FFB9C|nr:uncharacterized protein C6orf118 homolog [Talpa occidentalis]